MRTTYGSSGFWKRTRKDLAEKGELLLQTPAVLTLLECGGRLLLSIVLASARVLEHYSPFALGFVAASGSGPGGFCALIGASMGYLSSLGLVSGLRYVSAAILIYAVAFAFYDLKLYQTAWFMPLCAAAMGGLTGIVYLSEEGWQGQELLALGVELLLIGLSARCYRLALQPLAEPEQKLDGKRWGWALLFSGASLAAALSQMVVLGWLQLGLTCSAAAVLLLSQRQGGQAVSAGVVLGLTLDLSQGGGGLYTGALALGGLLAGLGASHGRVASGLLFLTGGMGAALCSGTGTDAAGLLLNLTAGTLVTLALPPRLLQGRARDRPQPRRVGSVLPVQESPTYTKQQLQAKLNGQAEAFQTLYEDMRKGLNQTPVTEQRLEQVFDRAAEQVCQSCPRYQICWKQDYHETYQAFHQMLTATQQRGYGKLSDAPVSFLGRCSRAGELVSAANVEYASLLHRRQLDARLRTSRTAVWRQYAQLSQLLSQAAQELESDLTPDPEQAAPVLRFLRRHGLEAEIRLGRDKRGRLVIQLFGTDLSPIREGRLLDDLCRNMGVSFAMGPLERDRAGQRMTLVQEDNFLATAGVAALSKEGQTVSGDGGNWFRDRDGILWVVLCDGMGSGPGAGHQSRLALSLLEDFLKAGIAPEIALATLSNALALRGEQQLGFTTIDLLGMDLFSGQCRSYKLGAAPTYLRQNGRVKKLTGNSLPAGLEFGQESRPDVRSFSLSREDIAVMVSDGVSDGEEDDWLWQMIRDFREQSPKKLATEILSGSTGGRDDRTVIVLQLKERPPRPQAKSPKGNRAAPRQEQTQQAG
ncbi:MAG: SpoIIE family protein phosphatase [Candidatus Onthomonas sp.]